MKGFIAHAAAPESAVRHFPFPLRLDRRARAAVARRARGAARARDRRDVVYPAYRRLIAYEAAARRQGDRRRRRVEAAGRRRLLRPLPAEHHHHHAHRRFSIHALGAARGGDAPRRDARRSCDAKGYHDRDLAGTMRRACAEPRLRYAAGDSGRAQILADYQAILDDANAARRARCSAIQPQGAARGRCACRRSRRRPRPAPTTTRPRSAASGRARFFANLRDPAETRRPEHADARATTRASPGITSDPDPGAQEGCRSSGA